MTAKEKAKELINQFHKVGCRSSVEAELHSAKQSALIATDELIKVAWWSSTGEMEEPYRTAQKEFWQQVKREIENSK